MHVIGEYVSDIRNILTKEEVAYRCTNRLQTAAVNSNIYMSEEHNVITQMLEYTQQALKQMVSVHVHSWYSHYTIVITNTMQ